MKTILKPLAVALLLLIAALSLNALVGALLAYLLGIPAWMGAVTLTLIALVIYPAKALREALENIGWFKLIRSYDEYVANDTIHFVELGGDPKVLVNNTTYPLNVSTVTDADKPVSLDNFETEATAIGDKELDTISYDKLGSVKERHKDTVAAKILAKSLHASS